MLDEKLFVLVECELLCEDVGVERDGSSCFRFSVGISCDELSREIRTGEPGTQC